MLVQKAIIKRIQPLTAWDNLYFNETDPRHWSKTSWTTFDGQNNARDFINDKNNSDLFQSDSVYQIQEVWIDHTKCRPRKCDISFNY